MSAPGRVLVTGASGFVGGAVVARLLRGGIEVHAAARRATQASRAKSIVIPDIADLNSDAWKAAFQGVGVVVHAAARVHLMRDASSDPLAEYRRVNRDGTLMLARTAAGAGVRRFVFLSSIKVNGESTPIDKPFHPDDPPHPRDSYGVSKLEAEEGLRQIASETGMEVVVIRPVLVYGPGVRANFRSMMRWIVRGIPLPFGSIHNARSLVGVANLADLIYVTTNHGAAANETFLVSDGADLSTTELLRLVAHALGRRARLIPVPARLLEWTATAVGKRELARRLTGSLRVNSEKTLRLLGWTPPYAIEEQLETTARAFLNETSSRA